MLAAGMEGAVGVEHAFFTKAWGDGADRELRGRFEGCLSVKKGKFLFCRQVHSAEVVTVGQGWEPSAAPEADAMVTNQKGLALGILTADCVPVLFADAEAGVIGAAHAGWRGALSGVLAHTLAAMGRLGGEAGRVRAALGPCIWQGSYQVGAAFPAPFLAEDARNQRFFVPDVEGKWRFDLPGYVVAKLEALGVGCVERSPADTCAEPERFFSHRYSTLRGEVRGGSLVSAIALAE